MSKLLEKSMDELCANTVDTVDRIMGRYNVGLEEACSVAGISAIDYSEWKENAPQMTFQEQEIDEHELEMKEKIMEKIVMHKIPDLLKLGITLENACEFAKITTTQSNINCTYEHCEISHSVLFFINSSCIVNICFKHIVYR